MSTSTLGGFEREERKILYDEYLFQRRVLFGITISIVFAAFIWTIAICTDHWIIVAGEKPIFIPISERFFLSSHTGLWRLCRYALTPILLTNSTLPQLLTKLIATNVTEIAQLKQEIANEAYIKHYLENFSGSFANITSIDNQFKQTMFALWLTESAGFMGSKRRYMKSLADGTYNSATTNAKHKKNAIPFHVVNNSNEIATILNIKPISVQVNGTTKAIVILPKSLQNALYDEWSQQPKVVQLLGKYAKDMNLPVSIIFPNDTQLVLRPPDPPAAGHRNSDYFYQKYENCKYHNFFPLTNEIEYDPSIDEVLLGNTNDTFEENNHMQNLEMTEGSHRIKNSSEWSGKYLLRTQASFACIALLIMSMAFVFSMYTFLNPRYMFKRLAAGVHFISASICFVVLRIVSYAVQHEKRHMDYLFPNGAEYTYGYGVYMAWAVFTVNASACFLFLWYSKKRKGNKAPTEELAMADEPINMGR